MLPPKPETHMNFTSRLFDEADELNVFKVINDLIQPWEVIEDDVTILPGQVVTTSVAGERYARAHVHYYHAGSMVYRIIEEFGPNWSNADKSQHALSIERWFADELDNEIVHFGGDVVCPDLIAKIMDEMDAVFDKGEEICIEEHIPTPRSRFAA